MRGFAFERLTIDGLRCKTSNTKTENEGNKKLNAPYFKDMPDPRAVAGEYHRWWEQLEPKNE